MKFKPIKLNGEQRTSLARFFYDLGKLAFAATVLDAFVRGGVSIDKTLVGVFATLFCVGVGLKYEEGVNNA